jgi:hypothetical protein
MIDIVDRLREIPGRTSRENDRTSIVEAANEIERLRNALRQIDSYAVAKKTGASVRMQRAARQALAGREQ